MAVSLVWPAMNHGPPHTVHPFFTPRPVHSEQDNAQPPAEDQSAVVEPVLGSAGPSDVQKTVKDVSEAEVGEVNGGVDGASDEKEPAAPVMTTGETKPAWPISSKPIEPHNKRRKLHHNGHVPDTRTIDPPGETLPDAPQASVADDNTGGNAVELSGHAGVQPSRTLSPPRKMLKLNASGKFASPPKPRIALKNDDSDRPAPKKRGRPKRSLIAVCHYSKPGSGENAPDFSALVTAILQGEYRHIRRDAKPKPHSKPSAPSKPAKATHPFFSGPPKKTIGSESVVEEDSHEVKPAKSPHRKSFASTPGKIRQQVAQMRSAHAPPPPFDYPRPTARNNTAKGDVWPGPGMMHVRAIDENVLPRPHTYNVSLRKKKLTSSNLDQGHSALSSIISSSDASEKRTREDGFSDPHPSLRLPGRALMTGADILQTVSSQLSSNHAVHPATQGLTNSVLTHMTAYDHGRGESLPWSLKYAPVEASTVLQSGVDAIILRDWMKFLTVNAVGSSLAPKAPAVSLPRKKRRKRAAELDDFLVSSGDEEEQFGALGGLDELGSQGSQGSRTLVRSALENNNGEPGKLANAVVLSGPHGCGKTAMVLAVAKELDFQVFEINAGSKRSRGDILARIGDVVANHIVSHGRADSGNTSADEDSRISAAFQKDLDSGRQGTMKSFFTSAPAKKESPKAARKQAVVNAANKALKAEPTRHQKQSVILLEEVDILFEEDKAFWEGIISLLATSRRPVVMTCTNDSILPLDAMTVHAIIRLAPPPDELAVDYLLLVAAQEGHLLSRDSVESLYRYKRRDLRASLTDLQFWCQMGIGDPRGGLSWIFQRWPPGTGVDANGNVQRVVSEQTHHINMGCFPSEREELSSKVKHRELLSDAWSDWSLDPRDETHIRLPETLAELDVDIAVVGNQGRLDALRKMEKLTESLSALDVQCQVGLPTSSGQRSAFAPLGSILKQRMDPTQPDMPSKLRSSFTEYPALLQADEAIDFAEVDRDITVTTCALLPAALGLSAQHSRLSDLIQEERPYAAFEAVPAGQLYGALEPLADDMLSGGNYTSLVLPLPALMTDIAPYVRSIAAHDHQRRSLYADLGGKRKTRAARGAVEGRGRNAVRRERWWECELDELSLTAGQHTFAAGARIAALYAAEGALVEDIMEE